MSDPEKEYFIVKCGSFVCPSCYRTLQFSDDSEKGKPTGNIRCHVCGHIVFIYANYPGMDPEHIGEEKLWWTRSEEWLKENLKE